MICEFCVHCWKNDTCGLGLDVPKRMSCREFDPGVERFCSNPADFVGVAQLVQMASFFGLRGSEMKKVREMAGLEAARRAPAGPAACLDVRGPDRR